MDFLFYKFNRIYIYLVLTRMFAKLLLSMSLVCALTDRALTQQYLRDDYVEKSHIKIAKSNSKVYLLGSQDELKKALGDVITIRSKDEISGAPVFTYQYKGLKVNFINHIFESASITNSSFYVLLNSVRFSVGDQIEKFKRYFPLAYKETSKGDNLVIYISSHKTYTDAYISFAINKNGEVTSIWIGNDNS